jgi:hypothetical protein
MIPFLPPNASTKQLLAELRLISTPRSGAGKIKCSKTTPYTRAVLARRARLCGGLRDGGTLYGVIDLIMEALDGCVFVVLNSFPQAAVHQDPQRWRFKVWSKGLQDFVV